MFNNSILGGIVFYMCFSLFSYTQAQNSFKIPDTLKAKTYKELKTIIENSNYNYLISGIHAKSLIQKAKNEQDSISLAEGYHYIAFMFQHEEKGLLYLDSLIDITKKWNHLIYPSHIFNFKGDIYRKKLNFKKALDNYLLANKYLHKDNSSLRFQIKMKIGLVQSNLGEYKEALVHLKEFHQFISKSKKKDSIHYYNSIYNLSNVYRKLDYLDSASFYNKKGFLETKHNKKGYWHHQFILLQGIVEYSKENYRNAVDSISKVLPFFKQKKDSSDLLKENLDLLVVYSYLGKSHYKFNNQKQGINYLKKAVSIFQKKQSVVPETKVDYRILIDYYKSIKSLKNELYYSQLLLKFDSILQSDYRYLNKKIINEYENNKLIQEKDLQIQATESKRRIEYSRNTILIILLLIAIGGIIYFFNKQRIYKKRFNQFIQAQKNKNLKSQKTESKEAIDVPDEIINHILNRLEIFKNKQGYTDQHLSLTTLAKKLNTNSKYLSMVINFNENKSFRIYINDLRIQYAIDRLQKDRFFRKYAVKSIAQEVGFNNSETFAKAFHRYSGLYPSFFIKQLEK
ncbi:helix-turn-helix domain-containing protein [Flavobacteriaceae bacterium R38]|nr:helix-turn-helix domain-containing protein [Flavobacteriaceae bacterium R38]